MTMSLADVYLGLGGHQPHPALAAVRVDNYVIDSRHAGKGSVFVALPGERTDGHHFIGDALARGAAAIIAAIPPAELAATVVRPDVNPAPSRVDGPILFQVTDSLAALQQLAASWRSRHQPT